MALEGNQRHEKKQQSRCKMSSSLSASSCEEVAIKYVCGIDIGSQSCAGCICRPDKSLVVKPTAFANAKDGRVVREQLSQRRQRRLAAARPDVDGRVHDRKAKQLRDLYRRDDVFEQQV